jgi:hypothetical protein
MQTASDPYNEQPIIEKSEPSIEATRQPSETNTETLAYVSGIKLVLLVISIVLACFLMLLDTSVVSTVSKPNWPEWNDYPKVQVVDTEYRLGHPADHRRVSLTSGCRLVRQCLQSRKVRDYSCNKLRES